MEQDSFPFVFHTNMKLILRDNCLRSCSAASVHEAGQQAVTAVSREPLMLVDLIKVMQNEEVCCALMSELTTAWFVHTPLPPVELDTAAAAGVNPLTAVLVVAGKVVQITLYLLYITEGICDCLSN